MHEKNADNRLGGPIGTLQGGRRKEKGGGGKSQKLLMNSLIDSVRSDVLLSTVCEVNERVLPAITLKPEQLSRAEAMDVEEADEAKDEVQSPDIDVCVLKPLDFDPLTAGSGADGGPCLALHHRRRFSRQRGSISLDGTKKKYNNV